jgi:Fur family transcriptional regulator, iron response regulator
MRTGFYHQRPFASAIERLRAAGLRPTRQRLAILRRLFEGGDRHVTAETLHEEASSLGVKVSLATVYNTLHQFTKAGLLREVVVDGAKTYFDTNTSSHHHFFDIDHGDLTDIPGEGIAVAGLPQAPEGMAVDRVDIVVRVRQSNRK